MVQKVLEFDTIVSEPFAENTYIAWLVGSRQCVVVDPGLAPREVDEVLDRHGLAPSAILNTHGHADHIAGNGWLKRRWPDCPLVIGRRDAPKLTDAQLNLSAAYGLPLTSPPADTLLDDGAVYTAGGLAFDVHEIPGHSVGHVVYVWKGNGRYYVFGGDVLMAGSIGRTDFPDGSFRDLSQGIWSKLFTLPDDTLVLPGHGPTTTIGEEKSANPFVGRPAGWRPL